MLKTDRGSLSRDVEINGETKSVHVDHLMSAEFITDKTVQVVSELKDQIEKLERIN